MGSGCNEAIGQRFIDEFGEDVIRAIRPKSSMLSELFADMWLEVTDGWEEVRVFARLIDGGEEVVVMFPDQVFHAELIREEDLVERLMAWTGQPESVVRDRIQSARLFGK